MFDWSMFIKYIKYCFLEVTYVKFIKGEIVNMITEFSIVKFFAIAICYNFGSFFSKPILSYVTISKWKSEIPVSNTLLCWK